MKVTSEEQCQLWDSFVGPEINLDNCKRKERITFYYDNAKNIAEKKEIENIGKNCATCSQYLKNFQDEQMILDSLIPSPFLDQESADSLKYELIESIESVFSMRKLDFTSASVGFFAKLNSFFSRYFLRRY